MTDQVPPGRLGRCLDVQSESGQVPGGGRVALHSHHQLPFKAFCTSAFRHGKAWALMPGAPMTVSQHSNPQRVRSRMASSTAEGAVPAKRRCSPVRHSKQQRWVPSCPPTPSRCPKRRRRFGTQKVQPKEMELKSHECRKGGWEGGLTTNAELGITRKWPQPPRQALLRSNMPLSYTSEAFT